MKFFSANGTKLPDEIERAIEEALEEPMTVSESLGKAVRIDDAAGRYVEYCKGTMPWGFSLRGLNIVLDCANGATYNVGPNVFNELGAEVITMAVAPNGANINRDCGSTKPKALQEKVLEEQADMGIAFDGDGDRLVFVDHKGEVVDGDEILYIIAAYRQQYGSGCSGVAGTLMSNFGFELAMRELKIPFVRANVGDRYVIQAMRENGWQLGGESSGHIICADVSTTGDGIIAALQVLLGLVTAGENLHDYKQGMNKLPMVMINVRMNERRDLSANTAVNEAVAAVEAALADRGRVLLRASGTEPLIRVMVEGDDAIEVEALCKQLTKVVEAEVA